MRKGPLTAVLRDSQVGASRSSRRQLWRVQRAFGDGKFREVY